MAPSPDNRTIEGIYDTNVVIKFETVLAIQGPNIGIIKYINKNWITCFIGLYTNQSIDWLLFLIFSIMSCLIRLIEINPAWSVSNRSVTWVRLYDKSLFECTIGRLFKILWFVFLLHHQPSLIMYVLLFFPLFTHSFSNNWILLIKYEKEDRWTTNHPYYPHI